MPGSRKVCLACNEDGYGPSALGYYLARAMIEAWRDAQGTYEFDLRILVLNNAAFSFNQALYADFRDIVVPLRSEPDSLLRLEKPRGEVAVAETLSRLAKYKAIREPYLHGVRPFLAGSDLVIDVGVPLFARSAQELAVPRRITLFDHSWAETLRLICADEWQHIYRANPKPTPTDRWLAQEIAGWIERDESSATDVILFPPYLTPEPFRSHWAKLVGDDRLHVLSGVFGTRSDPQAARFRLDDMLKALGQQPVPAGRPLVLISPGGTSVWAELLPKMVHEFVARPREYIPIFSRPRALDDRTTQVLKARIGRSDAVRYFDTVPGSTQQAILPAFDLIVTRAGGGTVNDALASKTPLACVEEPHVQVTLTEHELLRRGWILELDETRLEEFQTAPTKCIDVFYSNRIPPSQVETGVEKQLARQMLEWLR